MKELYPRIYIYIYASIAIFEVIKLIDDFEVKKPFRNLSLSDFSVNDSQFRKRGTFLETTGDNREWRAI